MKIQYCQGWLVGATPEGGHLVPFELARAPGNRRYSISGAAHIKLKQDLRLCVLVALQVLPDLPPERFHDDWHLHIPADHLKITETSYRLALLYGVCAQLHRGATMPRPDQIALSGDVTLRGDILPVGLIDQKYKALRKSSLAALVVSKRQAFDATERLLKVDHASELCHLEIPALTPRRILIPKSHRYFGYATDPSKQPSPEVV